MGDPALPDAQGLTGVKLGAVARMGNQVVLRILGYLRANFVVSYGKKITEIIKFLIE